MRQGTPTLILLKTDEKEYKLAEPLRMVQPAFSDASKSLKTPTSIYSPNSTRAANSYPTLALALP
jgi:hypothetical protein